MAWKFWFKSVLNTQKAWRRVELNACWSASSVYERYPVKKFDNSTQVGENTLESLQRYHPSITFYFYRQNLFDNTRKPMTCFEIDCRLFLKRYFFLKTNRLQPPTILGFSIQFVRPNCQSSTRTDAVPKIVCSSKNQNRLQSCANLNIYMRFQIQIQ